MEYIVFVLRYSRYEKKRSVRKWISAAVRSNFIGGVVELKVEVLELLIKKVLNGVVKLKF